MNDAPTPETDAAILESCGQWSFALRAKMEKLERERDAARAEVEAMRKVIEEVCDDTETIIGENALSKLRPFITP